MSPSPEPDRSIFSLTPPDTPNRSVQTPPPKPVARLQVSDNIWTSPAFLKETPFPSLPSSSRVADPFWEVEDGWEERPPAKRTKFGRASGQWRFVERTPSPEAQAGEQQQDEIHINEEAVRESPEQVDQSGVQLTPLSDTPDLHDKVSSHEARGDGSEIDTRDEDAVDIVMMDESFEEPIIGVFDVFADTGKAERILESTVEDTPMVDATNASYFESVEGMDEPALKNLDTPIEELAIQDEQYKRSASVVTEVLSGVPGPIHGATDPSGISVSDNILDEPNSHALPASSSLHLETALSSKPVVSPLLGLDDTASSRQRSPGLHIEIRGATPLPDDLLDDHSQAPGTPHIQPLPSPGLSVVSPLETRSQLRIPSFAVPEEQKTISGPESLPTRPVTQAQKEHAALSPPNDAPQARERASPSLSSSSSFATQEADEALPELPSEVQESPSPSPESGSERKTSDVLDPTSYVKSSNGIIAKVEQGHKVDNSASVRDYDIPESQMDELPVITNLSNVEGNKVTREGREIEEEAEPILPKAPAKMSMIEKALQEAPLPKAQDSPSSSFGYEDLPNDGNSTGDLPNELQKEEATVAISNGSSSPILYNDPRLSDGMDIFEEEFATQAQTLEVSQPSPLERDTLFDRLIADFDPDGDMSEMIEMSQSYLDASELAEAPPADLEDIDSISSGGSMVIDENLDRQSRPASIEAATSKEQEKVPSEPESELPAIMNRSKIKPEVQDTYFNEAEMPTSNAPGQEPSPHTVEIVDLIRIDAEEDSSSVQGIAGDQESQAFVKREGSTIREQEHPRPTGEIVDLIGSNAMEDSSSIQDASANQEPQDFLKREETEPIEDPATQISTQQFYSSQPRFHVRDSFSEDALISSEVEESEEKVSQPQFTMPSELPSLFTQRSRPLTRAQSKLVAPEPMETDEDDIDPPDETIKTKDLVASHPRTPDLTQPTEGDSLQPVTHPVKAQEPTLPTPRLTQKSTKELEEMPLSQESQTPAMDSEQDEVGEETPKAAQPRAELIPDARSPDQPAAPSEQVKSSFFSQQPPSLPPILPQARMQEDPSFKSLHLEPTAGFRTSISYYVSLAYLHKHFNKKIDILTICVSATKPVKSQKGPRDWTQTLLLTDPSSSATAKPIIVAQLFRPSQDVLAFPDSGDVVLLRDVKVQTQKQKMMLISTNSSAWAVWRQGILENPDKMEVRGPPVEIGAGERGVVRGLTTWWASLDEGFRERIVGANRVVETEGAKDANGKARTEVNKGSRQGGDDQVSVGVDKVGGKEKRKSTVEVQVGVGRRAKQQRAMEQQTELTPPATRSKQKENSASTTNSPLLQRRRETTPRITRPKCKEAPTPLKTSPPAESHRETTPAVTRSQARGSSTPTQSSPTSQRRNEATPPNTRSSKQKGIQVLIEASPQKAAVDARSPKSGMKNTHILRNGVKYTDDDTTPRSRGGKTTTHELRDGKKWQDNGG